MAGYGALGELPGVRRPHAELGMKPRSSIVSIATTAWAISTGRSFDGLSCCACPARSPNSVTTSLGLSNMTRTLWVRSSARHDSVSPRRANLVEA